MSKLKFDRVVVFDLEATCWATEEERQLTPSEIIEIGACFLNIKTGDITNKTRYIIRPKVMNISEYCTKLTGHTIDSLKKGIPFVDACNKFRKEFGTGNKISAAYGNDLDSLNKECIHYGNIIPLSDSYINICHLFALKNKNSKVSLVQALEKIGEVFEGTQHHADDDAFNAAKVLKSILQ